MGNIESSRVNATEHQPKTQKERMAWIAANPVKERTPKHTIKIDAGKSIVVQPNTTGPGVRVSLELFGASMASAVLTADQCGALIVGIEVCNEKAVQS